VGPPSIKEGGVMTKYLNIENMTDSQKKLYEMGFRYSDKGKIIAISPNHFAIGVKKSDNLLYASDSKFYRYESGAWREVTENKLLGEFVRIIMKVAPSVWSTRIEKEYMTLLKRILYTSKSFNTRRHLINMENGMYDTVRNKLIPHDPKYLSTIQIPISYNKNARCPRYARFLSEVFEGDKERIIKAIEWLGYCISPETKAQRALIKYGSGSNGKGVYSDSLKWIVGEENISVIPLNELNNGFKRASLFGKTVNISSENEMNGKSFNTQYFKAITGQDTISAAYKFQDEFTFEPTVKLIIAMNNLPYSRDKSPGYYRRLDFLPFTVRFTGKDVDPDLKKKLRAELPGIFNVALNGLARLQRNKFKFSPCKASDDLLDAYKRDLEPIITFVDDCVEIADEAYREDNRKLYSGFKRWASANGHNNLADISTMKFWSAFETEMTNRGVTMKTGRSNAFRYHTGIKFVSQNKKSLGSKYHKSSRKITKSNSEMFDSDIE